MKAPLVVGGWAVTVDAGEDTLKLTCADRPELIMAGAGPPTIYTLTGPSVAILSSTSEELVCCREVGAPFARCARMHV